MVPRTVREEMLLQAKKEHMKKIGSISGWGSAMAIADLEGNITTTRMEIVCIGTLRRIRTGWTTTWSLLGQSQNTLQSLASPLMDILSMDSWAGTMKVRSLR